MEDLTPVSARAAGISKAAVSDLPVPEPIPLSVALPTIGIALWCFWTAFTATETLQTAVSTVMSPEVVADAAEPPKAEVLASRSRNLPVALLSSDACELAPLKIVLLCVFFSFFPYFYFSFYTCNVCNDYVRQKNTFGHRTALH